VATDAKSKKISKGKNNKVSTPKPKRTYNKKVKKLETNAPPEHGANFDQNEAEVCNLEAHNEALPEV
jgi:tryptophanyl-tRNA synthetase